MERRCGQKYELSPRFSTFDLLSPIFDRQSSTLDCFSPLLDPILNVTAHIYAIILRGYTTLDVIPRPSIFILDPRSSSSILDLPPRSSILIINLSSFDPSSNSICNSTNLRDNSPRMHDSRCHSPILDLHPHPRSSSSILDLPPRSSIVIINLSSFILYQSSNIEPPRSSSLPFITIFSILPPRFSLYPLSQSPCLTLKILCNLMLLYIIYNNFNNYN